MYKIIILTFLITIQVFSQELSEINKLMFDNYKRGDYILALQYGKEAQKITEIKYSRKSDIYITSISTLAIIYEAMDSVKKAEETLLEGINLVNENNLSPNSRLTMYNSLASLYQLQEKYNKAEFYYLEAMSCIRQNNLFENPSYFGIIKSLGMCSEYAGKLNEAEKYYLLALSFLTQKKQIQSPDYIEALGSLAAIYKKSGKYSKSEESYLKVLEMFKGNENNSSGEYAYYLSRLGGLYHDLNKYEKAEKYFSESKDIRLKIFGDSSADYAQSLNNLALLYNDIGKLSESESMYKKALSIWLKKFGNNSPIYAVTLNNMAVLIGKMGRTEEAMKLFYESLSIRKKVFGEESLEYAISLNNSAALFKNLGYFQEAEKFLNKSISLYKEILGKDHPDYITALSNLASVYDAEQKYDEAEKIYLEALSVRKKLFGTMSAYYANSLHNIGILYFRMKKYDNADAYLSEAKAARKEILGEKNLDYILSVSNMARLKEVMNNYDESKKLWMESLDLYVWQIHSLFPALSEDEKTKFYNSINEKFEMFNSFVMRHHESDSSLLNKLIDYQITIKGLLLNSLGKMRENILNSKDDRLKNLYLDWITIKEQLASMYSGNLKELSKPNNNAIDSLEQLANDHERELSLLSESYSGEFKRRQYSIDDIRTFLKPDERAVEVIRFRYNDSVYYAFIIISPGKKYSDVIYYSNGNDLEGRHYVDYINLIKNKINDKVSFKRFFEKVLPVIGSAKSIYYSPDGVYNKINLITLRKSDGSYPLKNFDISVITGMKDLFRASDISKPEKGAFLFGNPAFNTMGVGSQRDIKIAPLPGTEIEVKNIKEILDKQKISAKIYLQKEANVSNLKNVKNPMILHIATHGFFMEDVESNDESNLLGINKEKMKSNPLLRSGLILSGSGKTLTDTSRVGVLTSYEAMNIDLDSTLFVVLSACETGLGEIKNGEGVYGLQRAFMAAGAKYIIMSLWKVNDEVTSELMTLFYNYYFEENNVKGAFKKAQLKIAEKYKETLYWGAFVVLGI